MTATAAKKIPDALPANANAEYHERLRDRFLSSGENALADYELLKLILFYALPRRDTKALAKMLLQSFGSLAGVLSARPDDLTAVSGLPGTSATLLKAVHTAATRMGKTQVMNRPVLSNWEQLIAYCHVAMAHAREIIKRVLNLGASAIIMVHNHPSNDPSPNRADIQLTDVVSEAAQTIRMTLHDHIIIAKSAYYFFRAESLIK